MQIGIVGFGYVGKALAAELKKHYTVHIYDKYVADFATLECQNSVNRSDLVFIAVPTPTGEDGWACDLTSIHEVFSWLRTPACIKSTVPPGTTEALAAQYGVPVGFSPEYIGESQSHPWSTILSCGFVIVSGHARVVSLVGLVYRTMSPEVTLLEASPRSAELCKYMENCYLATKVTFANQFYDIAASLGVNFEETKSLWLRDQRIGSSHTEVTAERGFGGKCLPKDIRALIASVRSHVPTEFLEAIVTYNERIRKSRLTSEGIESVTAHR